MSSPTKPRRLYVRTPLIESFPLSQLVGCPVYLKLENTQPSASFKLRGVSNHIQKALAKGCTHLVCSSGGNAGIAAAYAARHLKTPITIIVPGSTPQYIKDRLQGEGAEVEVRGTVWDHADTRARELGSQPGWAYIAPFDHPDVWEGHESLMEEVAEDHPDPPGAVVVSVGGGGLLCGIVQGMNNVGWGNVPIVGMETIGADSYNQAVKSGKLVTLPDITSIAKCLGALTVCQKSLDYYSERPIISEVITDKQCMSALFRFLDDERILVEPACAAALSAVYSAVIQRLQSEGKLPQPLTSLVVVVCGGSMTNLAQINQWRDMVGGLDATDSGTT